MPDQVRPMKLLAVLCLLALAGRAAADELPLRKGDPVTILRTDGTTEKARFDSQVSDPPRLRLARPDARHWGGGSWNYELPTESIAQLQSSGDRDFKERRMLTGTLLGMAVGGVFGLAFGGRGSHSFAVPALGDQSYYASDGRMHDMASGMAGGAVLGFLLGVITGPSTGPNRHWTFDADGNAASSRAPDREP
jgi:hypothetical protein